MAGNERKRPEQRKGELGRNAALLGIAMLALLASLFVFVLGPSNVVRRFVQGIELGLYDARVGALPHRKPDPRIVIVGMDDDTPAAMSDMALTDRPYYPLSRYCQAALVNRLFHAGARVIGFDIMFAEPLKNQDDAFAAALAHQGNVVAAYIPHTERIGGVDYSKFVPPSPALAPYLQLASIVVPRPVRWFDPWQVNDEPPKDKPEMARIPHFGLAVAAAYYNEARTQPTLRDTFRWGTRIEAPLSNGEDVLVRYAGPSGAFPIIPYEDVFSAGFPAKSVRGKIVLVGRESQLDDILETPVGPMPGVEVHANIAQMALTRDYLRQAPESSVINAEFVLIALFLLVLWRFSVVPAVLAALVEGMVWGRFITVYQLQHNALWLDPTQPVVTLALAVIACTIYESVRLRMQFERFMPSWVAARAITGESSEPLGGKERAVTVVFCDIRNFTGISEQRPNEAVEILRRFFEAGDAAARRHGTELDKYVGDEIMLYFFDTPLRFGRAPDPRQTHPRRAVRWAQDMLAAARAIDATGLAGNFGFRIGIGIASGIAREGLIGVKGRVQNTVIGDVVNTASRLQDLTKQLGRPVVMSEATYRAVQDYVAVESLGEVPIRGKADPVAVYALGE